MKKSTENKLQEAKEYCNENDKSVEFTLQYMQDYANVDLNCVIKFLTKENGKITGLVTDVVFKGVHYEIIVVDQQNNKEWIIHTIHHTQAGIEVGLDFTSEAIHVMRMEVIDE